MRYRFGDFVLSPARRVLTTTGGRVVPLIPRYFDLLVLLVEQRDRAVTKQEIFDLVWTGVVVSDSALTQAIRTIRRTLDDDSREPRFVRTVSRHGYQFVFAPVEVEEDSSEPWPTAGEPGLAETTPAASPGSAAPVPDSDRFATPWQRALALAPGRGAAAAFGVATAGAFAGLIGGFAIRYGPGSEADTPVVLSLAIVGALAGLLGGGGVGIGIAAADAVARSKRVVALTCGGALMGGLTGWLAHHAARTVLTGVFGRDIPGMGGPLEGLVLGAFTGLGYAVATRHLSDDAMDPSRAPARWRVAAITGMASAIGATALALSGGHLVASSLDLMSSAFAGSQVGLEPLARLLGQDHLRPLTRVLVSAFEGVLFGSGLAFGLTMSARRT